jgi:hypothetical protein
MKPFSKRLPAFLASILALGLVLDGCKPKASSKAASAQAIQEPKGSVTWTLNFSFENRPEGFKDWQCWYSYENTLKWFKTNPFASNRDLLVAIASSPPGSPLGTKPSDIEFINKVPFTPEQVSAKLGDISEAIKLVSAEMDSEENQKSLINESNLIAQAATRQALEQLEAEQVAGVQVSQAGFLCPPPEELAKGLLADAQVNPNHGVLVQEDNSLLASGAPIKDTDKTPTPSETSLNLGAGQAVVTGAKFLWNFFLKPVGNAIRHPVQSSKAAFNAVKKVRFGKGKPPTAALPPSQARSVTTIPNQPVPPKASVPTSTTGAGATTFQQPPPSQRVGTDASFNGSSNPRQIFSQPSTNSTLSTAKVSFPKQPINPTNVAATADGIKKEQGRTLLSRLKNFFNRRKNSKQNASANGKTSESTATPLNDPKPKFSWKKKVLTTAAFSVGANQLMSMYGEGQPLPPAEQMPDVVLTTSPGSPSEMAARAEQDLATGGFDAAGELKQAVEAAAAALGQSSVDQILLNGTGAQRENLALQLKASLDMCFPIAICVASMPNLNDAATCLERECNDPELNK